MTKSTTTLEPLLTIKQLAALLNVSVKTVRRRIASGKLVAIRDGAIVRIDPKEVRAYRAEHRSE